MKNLLFMTRYQMLRIVRKKSWVTLITVGITVTLVCFFYPFIVNEEPIAIMSQTVFGQAMLTLSFMMMGIELRKEDSQEHVDDLAATYLRHTGMQPWSQIMVIFILSISITLFLCSGCLVPLIMDEAPMEWIRQTMIQVVLAFCLPCLILGIWGMLVQLIIPGKNVYFPAIVVWVLTSSMTIYFTEPLSEHFTLWRLFFEAFSMGFNNYQMYQNIMTGMKNEFPRWIVRSICILLVAAGYILSYKRKCASSKKQLIGSRIRNGVAVVAGVALLATVLVWYSEFFIEFADDTYTQEITYEKGLAYQAGESVSLTDWPTEKNITLKKTDIHMSCTTQGLRAEVLITASVDTEIANQTFTLFSDFIVDEVYVDGESVTFEQKNGGVIVNLPTIKQAGETVEFRFLYHGFSLPIYPVNESTVQLNRAFAWFPWPGLKVASENEIEYYYLSELFYIADWQRGDTVEYTLEYDGPGYIYTNLQQVEANVYSGKSDNGVTLYSGMLTVEHQEIDVYYPASMYRYATVAAEAVATDYAIVYEFCEEWGAPIMPEAPDTVAIVQIRYPMWGYVLFRPNELYSWGNEWEIRMRNESSSVLVGYSNEISFEEYASSDATLIQIAIPYLLNPCSGYPVDAPSSATHCFADLLAMSFFADEWDEFAMQSYMEQFKEAYFYDEGEEIYRDLQIIFTQMMEGNQVIEQLKTIYNRLLQSEQITPEEIITILLSDQEVKNEH